MKFLQPILLKGYAPRWLILQIDLFICLFAVTLGYLLRFEFDISKPGFEALPKALVVYFFVRLSGFYIFKTYKGIVRYTSTQDAKRIVFALASGSFFLTLVNLMVGTQGLHFPIPFLVLIFEFFATTFFMTSLRVAVKITYSELKSAHVPKKNVVIFGAGESGLLTKRTVDQDKDSGRRVIGFFDDATPKKGKTLEGVVIYNFEEHFEQLIEKVRIDELIIAVQNISRKRKEQIVDLCLKHQIQVKTVPPATDWINGTLTANQIQAIRIEDLLEREPIRLDQEQIRQQIRDKRVLVTGACGSIGSELVRQILPYLPGQLILVDQAETPLYELELELREKFGYINFTPVLADVRDRDRLDSIFQQYKPEIVYHAAAYKHVPLIESNPVEAIHTNVIGTKNMADLSVCHDVETFIFVSTDKAVNPTNVMGASKRIAEIYVQSLNMDMERKNMKHTKFITTRFGNVLGSNGSVIPRFRKQLEAGGPITVTHPEISRYFMTIPEACQLILEAGMMGKGGEIFVFDMGEVVKIVDLARKMITLSGFRPNVDIQITFTGLRPGEKLTEELLNHKERTMPTHHEKIMIGKVREYPFDVVAREIEELAHSVAEKNNLGVVAKMKAIVPEFISNNSVYQELDKVQLSQISNVPQH